MLLGQSVKKEVVKEMMSGVSGTSYSGEEHKRKGEETPQEPAKRPMLAVCSESSSSFASSLSEAKAPMETVSEAKVDAPVGTIQDEYGDNLLHLLIADVSNVGGESDEEVDAEVESEKSAAKARVNIAKMNKIIKSLPQSSIHKLNFLNQANKDGDTPLMLAMEGDKDQIALFLLRSGADPRLIPEDQEKPLLWAVGNENSGYLVREMLKIDSVKSTINLPSNQFGDTPLHAACERCDQDLISVLLDGGANHAQKNNENGGNKTPMQLLAEEGADLLKVRGGITKEGLVNMFVAFLEKGANTDIAQLKNDDPDVKHCFSQALERMS